MIVACKIFFSYTLSSLPKASGRSAGEVFSAGVTFDPDAGHVASLKLGLPCD